jgi:hypothetical protein
LLAIVEAMIAAGDVAGATLVAATIATNPELVTSRRAAAFIAIANAELDAGDHTAALLALYEADNAIHTIVIDQVYRSPELVGLARAQSRAGYFYAGIATAVEAAFFLEFDALRAVFAGYRGDVEAALEYALSFPDPDGQVAALIGLAEGSIARGLVDSAAAELELAAEIAADVAYPAFDSRLSLAFYRLLELAEVQLVAGNEGGAETAVTLAATLLPRIGFEGARALVQLAAATIDAERRAAILADALSFARALNVSASGARVAITVVAAEDRAAAGDIDGALALAVEIDQAFGATAGYAAIAAVVAEAGDTARAVAIAGAIVSPADRVAAYLGIAAAMD